MRVRRHPTDAISHGGYSRMRAARAVALGVLPRTCERDLWKSHSRFRRFTLPIELYSARCHHCLGPEIVRVKHRFARRPVNSCPANKTDAGTYRLSLEKI